MNIYYDISLDDEGFRIDLFKEEIITKKVDNKIETFRTFKTIESNYTDDLEGSVKKLQEKGYINGSKVIPEDYLGVEINNPVLKLKLLLLRKKIKLLEKIYTYEVIDNFCYIKTYMTYINLDNGLVNYLYLGSLGIYHEDKINDLNNKGYIFIKDSSLNEHLNTLHQNKKMVLNRKKSSN